MENAICHFVFYTGPRKGEAQAFTTARASIGRAANCDFRLTPYQLDQIAPHHAELLLEDAETYYLYDLGTKSGTYVNGERVHERCYLMNEDYIRFGEEGPEVIFRTGPPATGRQPLPDVFPVTAELEFFTGSDAGRIFPVNAASTSNIGRRADLEVPLDPRGDMIVSGNHCNIRYVNGHFVLTDTSRNGTYVNGDLVDQPMEILDGDVIMLGDGGPQARFRVDQARRHYPNHRPLSPKKPGSPAAAPEPKKPATAPATLASAKPFATGTVPSQPVQPPAPPPVDAPLSPEAEAVNQEAEIAGEAREAEAAAPPAPTAADDNAAEPTPPADFPESTSASAEDIDEDTAPNGTPAATAKATSTPTVPATRPKLPAFVPAALQSARKLSPKKLAIVGGGAALLLIIVLMLAKSSGPDETAGSARGSYAADLKELQTNQNINSAFSVKAPQSWATVIGPTAISISSADKNIAVDYVRDARVSKDRLINLLTKEGAERVAGDKIKVDGQELEVERASVGNVRRLGLLLPTGSGQAPIMVTLEATQEALDRLSGADLQFILAENSAATGPLPLPASPAPTPTPTPAVTEPPAPPAPSADTTTSAATAPPAPATAATTASQGQQAPETASATPAPAASDEPTTPTGPVIKSASLKLDITAPAGWTGTSEEADEMVMLTDGSGLVVRIARDPADLDAAATFKAMEEEDWKRKGVRNTPHYSAGEFEGKGQNLLLVIVPEKAKTTMLIYATAPKTFSQQQREDIRDILVQLLPQ